jgi:hypothetical protein
MKNLFVLLLCLLLAAPALAQNNSSFPSGGGGSTPGGASTDLQFNSGGTVFGGDSGLTYAGVGGVLTLTPAANTAQPFLITGGSVTSAGTGKLGLSVVGTLNTSGVVDGAALFANVTNTASGAGSLIIDLQAGGASVFSLGFDTPLLRDAAATIAARNGTTAQTFRVYNTFTSATSYERGTFDWNLSTNTLVIGTEKGSGGGSVRNINFIVGGTGKMDYGVSAASTWTLQNNVAFPGGNISISGGSLMALFATTLQGVSLASDLQVFWNSTVAAGTSGDTGFARNAAGVVEVNGGTKGTITGTLKPANVNIAGSVPVDGGGSCTASSFAGGASAGTFSAAVCTGGTIAITFAFTAPTGWSCDAEDRTTPSTGKLQQNATTTTKATFLATNSAADVVQYKCIAY